MGAHMGSTLLRRAVIASTAIVTLIATGSIEGASATAPRPHTANTSFVAKLTCTSTSTCQYLGQRSTSGVGGATFGRTTHASTQSFTSISTHIPGNSLDMACPSNSNCFVVGGSANGLVPLISKSTNGGATWHNAVIDVTAIVTASSAASGTVLGATFTQVACGTIQFCIAIGTAKYQSPLGYYPVMVQTTNGGLTWTPIVLGALLRQNFETLTHAICTATISCLATSSNGNMMETLNSGALWSSPAAGIFSAGPDAFACHLAPTMVARVCGAVYTSGTHVYFVGGHPDYLLNYWNYYGTIASGIDLPVIQSVACLKTYCVAVGSNGQRTRGVIYASLDNGQSWHLMNSPTNILNFTTVAIGAPGVAFVGGAIGTFPNRAVVLRSTGNTDTTLHAFVNVVLPSALT